MRPDQHKQKKNAQYKKKHGLQGKGDVEGEKGKGGGGRGRGRGKGHAGKWDREADKTDGKSTTVKPDDHEEVYLPSLT